MIYDSFLLKDDFEDNDSPFFEKHDKSYEERYAEWKAIEDNKSLAQLLEECKERAYEAVRDIMVGMHNAPHNTLKVELQRGYALEGLISDNPKRRVQFLKDFEKLPPPPGPTKTFHDYAAEAVQQMSEQVDRAIMRKMWK